MLFIAAKTLSGVRMKVNATDGSLRHDTEELPEVIYLFMFPPNIYLPNHAMLDAGYSLIFYVPIISSGTNDLAPFTVFSVLL